MGSENRQLTAGAAIDTIARRCPVCDSDGFDSLYSIPDYRVQNGDSYIIMPLFYVTCNYCAHIYLNPCPDPVQMDAVYANSMIAPPVEAGEKDRRGELHFSIFKHMMNEKIVSRPGELSVLEVGCGNGYLLGRIANEYRARIRNVTGIEPSGNLALAAQKGYGFPVYPVSLERFETDSRFDLIILDNVLEHFTDPREQLGRIGSILADDGLLYVSVPNILKINSGLRDLLCSHPSNYLLENLRFLLEEQGFEIVQVLYEAWWLNIVAGKTDKPRRSSTAVFAGLKCRLYEHLKDQIERHHNHANRVKEYVESIVAVAERDKEKLIIYGAGDHTGELFARIDFKQTIRCLVDINPYLRGTKRMGYSVYTPDDLGALEYHRILISSRAFEQEIKARLLAAGIPEERIITIYQQLGFPGYHDEG